MEKVEEASPEWVNTSIELETKIVVRHVLPRNNITVGVVHELRLIGETAGLFTIMRFANDLQKFISMDQH